MFTLKIAPSTEWICNVTTHYSFQYWRARTAHTDEKKVGYVYLCNDRQRRNSNGKSGIFDNGELDKSVG